MSELPALQPGQVVQVCWETSAGGPAALFGQLREQRGPELLLVPSGVWPTELPSPAQSVTVQLYAGDGLHQAPARVLAAGEGEGLRLALAGLDQRLQRRRYERVGLGLRPTPAALLGEGGEPARTFLARLVDLSASGVRLLGPAQLQPGSRVVLRLLLDDGPLLATARVIRVSPADHPPDSTDREPWQTAGAAFEALEPTERSRLFRFVRRRLSAEPSGGLSAASSAASRG